MVGVLVRNAFLKGISRLLQLGIVMSILSPLPLVAGQQLSLQEREELGAFFRMLFRYSTLPYTLFGNKPVSVHGYLVRSYPFDLLMPEDWYMHFPRKYDALYEKYQACWASENYLVVDQSFTSKKFPTSGYVRDLIIINKAAFLEVVEQHKPLFQKRLGEQVDGMGLWEECQSGRSILCDVFKEDELLWGVLLGFGKHNAQMYVQEEEHLRPFYEGYDVDLIPMPGFHCDRCHTETEALKESYRQVQKEITMIYNSPDFLDIILKKLE